LNQSNSHGCLGKSASQIRRSKIKQSSQSGKLQAFAGTKKFFEPQRRRDAREENAKRFIHEWARMDTKKKQFNSDFLFVVIRVHSWINTFFSASLRLCGSKFFVRGLSLF
jgi:hypothetical protein